MSTTDLRPGSATTGGSAASRFELLAALIASEAERSGDPIGYQHTIVEILHCLDEVDRGQLDDGECAEQIYAHIVGAVGVDPFDRRALTG